MNVLRDGAQVWGISLQPRHIELFRHLYEELLLWNERANLTAITDPVGMQVKHYLDSLAGLQAIPATARRLIDVGTGAGFPGLPLAIVRPDLTVVLVDSIAKKTAFIHHVIVHLGLTNVSVVTARAEHLGHDPLHRESYDVAVARAVGDLSVVAEYTLPLVRVGGRAIAYKGAQVTEELEAARSAMTILGGATPTIMTYQLPGLEARTLVIMEKVQSTPATYPRRAGRPAKRPLR